LFQAGIKNIVASSGTALTVEQVHLISRYTKNVILLYDADVAGIKAARRGIELILEQGLDLSIVTLPDGEDPDSFVRSKGAEEFEKQIASKKSIITFISSLYRKEGKLSSPEDKTAFIKEIISYIVRIPDKIKISFYIKELAETYRLYESDMRDELARAYKEFKKTQFPKTSVTLPKRNISNANDVKKVNINPELELLEIMFSNDYNAINFIVDQIYIQFITDSKVLHIFEILLDEWHNFNNFVIPKLIEQIKDEELISIILEQATPKYEMTITDYLPDDSFLARVSRERIDNYFKAKQILHKLEMLSYNREIKKNKELGKYDEALKIVEKKRKMFKRK